MKPTYRLLGGSLISLFLVAVTLFSMCGIHLQRLQNESEFVFTDEELGEEPDTRLEDMLWLKEESAAADSLAASAALEETEEAKAFLEQLEGLEDADRTSAENGPLPADSMDRLRQIVQAEMMEMPAAASPSSPPSPGVDELLAQYEAPAPAAAAQPRASQTAPISATRDAGDQAVAMSSREPSPVLDVPPQPFEPTFAMLYQEALDEFYAHRYTRAIAKFRKLLLRNDAGDLADNCQYWIGESFFAMGDYYQAIAEFEKVYLYPDANKLADAQLMMGVALMKIGEKEQARTELTLLTQMFKRHPAIAKARFYLGLLQRT